MAKEVNLQHDDSQHRATDLYCCKLQCFIPPRKREDGVKCFGCMRTSYCLCVCATYRNNILQRLKSHKEEALLVAATRRINIDDFCCALQCFKVPRTGVEGIACSTCLRYSYCCCKCLTFHNKIEEHFKAKAAASSSGVDHTKSDTSSYCCELKCFTAPTIQVDGQDCDVCEADEYCLCNCITYMNDKNNVKV